MKKIYSLIVALCLISISTIETYGQGSEPVIELKTTITGTKNYKARDEVKMLPGFYYKALTTSTLSAQVEQNVVCSKLTTDIPVNTPFIREINTSLPVGTTAGSASVSPTGAATYQIPVFVSPGTAGLQPQLSISYTSQGGNGIMGMGWNLVGLSSINRTPQTIYLDGAVKGIELVSNDKFAIDGNRLILTSGTYGSEGSIYGTEFEMFAKISYGTFSAGSAYFKVETKDGLIQEYGNSIDSKVEAHGTSTPLMWRLNKVTDPNGNYINYVYKEISGESYIDRIDYTGSPEFLPYNSIKFIYDQRSDKNTFYVGGREVLQTVLLRSIRMESEGNLIREYKFNYTMDFYSHLTEVVEYGSDGSHLNSTIINWGGSTPFITRTDSNYKFPLTNAYYPGDFNGDGKTDILVATKTSGGSWDKWYLQLASGGDSFAVASFGSLGSNFKGFYISDIDNDGDDDVLWRTRGTYSYQDCHPCDDPLQPPASQSQLGTIKSEVEVENEVQNVVQPPDECCDTYSYPEERFYFYFFNGTTLQRGATNYDLVYANADADIMLEKGDFNGDGKVDFMISKANKNLYTFRGLSVSNMPNFNSPDYVNLVDFNGDGKTDILVAKDALCTIYQYNTSNQQFESIYSSGFPTKWHKLFPGDFNGDGKTDLLFYNSSVGWKLQFSTGTGFSWPMLDVPLQNKEPKDVAPVYNIFVQDMNGDGKSDIIELYSNYIAAYTLDNTIKIHFSQGNGVFNTESAIVCRQYIGTFQYQFIFADINGDGKNEILGQTDACSVISIHKDEQKHVVQSIINGYNQKTEFTYKPLTYGPYFYTKESGATFPMNDFMGSMNVVETMSEPNSLNSISTTSYSYSGAKMHLQGKGFIGFMSITSTNNTTGVLTKNYYEYNNTFFNLALRRSYVFKPNYPISDLTYVNAVNNLGSKKYFPYISRRSIIDALKLFETATDYSYDNYGNQTSISVNTGGSATKITTNEYALYGGWGPHNKLTKTTVSNTYTGKTSYVRVTQFSYDTKGNLTQDIVDPGKVKSVTTKYVVNSHGLVDKSTVEPSDLLSRSTNYKYDPKYRFTTEVTNPLNNTSNREYNYGTGDVTKEIDINTGTTSYTYDGYGRLLTTKTPQGYYITSTYTWALGSLPTGTYYKVTTSAPYKSTQTISYDVFGRVLRDQKDGLNGLINIDKEYNNLGQLVKESKPYYDGSTPTWITYGYDVYGRNTTKNSQGLTTSFSYGSDWFETTYPDGKKNKKTFDRLGNTIESKDNLQGKVTFTYNSMGKPTMITSEGGYVSDIEYDEYGNQTSLKDPNAGKTDFSYNSLGELTTETNANGNVTNMSYDILGRLTQKVKAEGTTSYDYVTSGNGLEMVSSVTSGTNGKAFQYDSFGNVIQIVEKIQSVDYTTTYSYDSYGNNTGIVYPSGFGVTNVYNSKGFMTEVKRTDNQTTIWKLDKESALGQPEQFSQGNNLFTTNYSYDNYNLPTEIKAGTLQNFGFNFNPNNGNLTMRQDKLRSLTETFDYDELNRLKLATVSGQSPLTIQYAPNGNINFKSDAGNYSYNPTKLNFVEMVTNNPLTLPEQVQEIKYTSFNKAYEIKVGNNKLNLIYGVDDERVRTELFENSLLKTTKIFARNYEKETKNGITRELHYINGSYGLEAIYIKQGETGSMFYVCKDHIGSITALVNESKIVAEEYSFDAWGRRRNYENWTYSNVNTPALIDRGFTGHEHLVEFGLINMNGRTYDPVLGRFLSPDKFVQTPDFTQNFNRYSYGLNNPLVYTDPSGDFFWVPVIIGAVVGAYTGGVVANHGQYNPTKWDYSSGKTWGYMLGGAVVGGFSGYIGASIAATGGFMSSTMSIMYSSAFNSMGMSIVTDGQTPVSISFGVASFNFSTGGWSYLGKSGNSAIENIGYGLGALANISDVLRGFKPGEVQLQTESTPDVYENGKDLIGHSQLLDKNGKSLIDFGPDGSFFGFDQGRNNWIEYASHGSITQTKDVAGNIFKQGQIIKGVNLSRVISIGNRLNSKPGFYNFLLRSCSQQVARTLTLSGVPVLGLHPYLLQAQISLINMGVRPSLFSYYLYYKY